MDTTYKRNIDTEATDESKPTVKAPARAGTPLGRRRPTFIGGAALLGIGILIGSIAARSAQNSVVMTVNGEPIRQNDFRHRLDLASGAAVLRQMTQESLAIQFAAKMGVTPASQEVDARYSEMSKQPDFTKTLASNHQTMEDVKHAILVDMAQKAVIDKGVVVTDADIMNFYKQNTDPKNPNARYYQPNAVQVAAVISDKEDDIKKALHDLAAGVSFVNVAKAYSKDKSAANGGVLPPIRAGQTDAKRFPGLEKQLLTMHVGQQLDTVKMAGAYWIVRCIGTSKEATVPFEKVKEECRQGAMLTKGLQTNGQTVQASLADFQKTAEIKVLNPQFQDATAAK